jgi:hypothetical protein
MRTRDRSRPQKETARASRRGRLSHLTGACRPRQSWRGRFLVRIITRTHVIFDQLLIFFVLPLYGSPNRAAVGESLHVGPHVIPSGANARTDANMRTAGEKNKNSILKHGRTHRAAAARVTRKPSIRRSAIFLFCFELGGVCVRERSLIGSRSFSGALETHVLDVVRGRVQSCGLRRGAASRRRGVISAERKRRGN